MKRSISYRDERPTKAADKREAMAIQRHKYTDDELEEYFERICLPHRRRVHDVSHLSDEEKLTFLHLLQKHHLVKCPWENLVQHYSWHHVVNVSPKHLFRKVVKQPGRGGYCMEINYFFHLILYSLNFSVYMCGSRIYKPPKKAYGGWTHIINLVTIADQKYLLDGGLGAAGPTYPVPLLAGEIQPHIEPAQCRLLHEPIPEYLNRDHKVWIYQHRYDFDSDWATCYCFGDLEFTPTDIIGLNFEPWTNPHTFFTHKCVAVRFSTSCERNGPMGPGSPNEKDLEGEIDGAVTLNHDVLKWRRNGKKVSEVPFKTEEDRVQALEMYFGIKLAEEDREGIQGTAAMIGARAMLNDS